MQVASINLPVDLSPECRLGLLAR